MKILRTGAPLCCFALIHDVSEEREGSVPPTPSPFKSDFFKNTKNSSMTFRIGPIGLQLFAIYTTVFKNLQLDL
jgi:hypothetical protein